MDSEKIEFADPITGLTYYLWVEGDVIKYSFKFY